MAQLPSSCPVSPLAATRNPRNGSCSQQLSRMADYPFVFVRNCNVTPSLHIALPDLQAFLDTVRPQNHHISKNQSVKPVFCQFLLRRGLPLAIRGPKGARDSDCLAAESDPEVAGGGGEEGLLVHHQLGRPRAGLQVQCSPVHGVLCRPGGRESRVWGAPPGRRPAGPRQSGRGWAGPPAPPPATLPTSQPPAGS